MNSHVVLLQQVDHFLLAEGTIVRNDLIRGPLTTDDIILDELGYV